MKVTRFREKLPPGFVEKVVGLCGRDGEKWLSDLPRVIERLEERFKMRFEAHFDNLSYNFVGSCVTQDGIPAVLKIALPLPEPEIFNEAKALKIFAGKGAVGVLKLDLENRAILLERSLPGIHLK
ncbi:MAG: hypothetical protein KDB79_02695, partial [Acidobacteria bacterium]|nr:hypothetical protein [Acidobacteriota bacterium]